MLLQRLSHLLQQAGGAVHIEPNWFEGKRPDAQVNFSRGNIMIDASITHPSAPSLCRSAAARPLAAAKRREKLKESKYSTIARDEECQFVPFVMESYGSFGKQAFKFLKEVSYHSNDTSLLPVTTIQMVRALSICLQTGNAFVLLSGCMQAREWKSACRRQRYGLVGYSPNQNEDDDLYPLSDDETDAPTYRTQSILSPETETIDLTTVTAAQASSTSSVEVGSDRKQVELEIREMLTALVDRIVTSEETRKVDSSSSKRKNSDTDLVPNKKQREKE